MKVALEAIQERFPNPVAVLRRRTQADYCVGGALCLYMEMPASSFPTRGTLADALMKANPDLLPGHASTYADIITLDNDTEEFGKAWAALARALAFKRNVELYYEDEER